jgi:hypothetical protein
MEAGPFSPARQKCGHFWRRVAARFARANLACFVGHSPHTPAAPRASSPLAAFPQDGAGRVDISLVRGHAAVLFVLLAAVSLAIRLPFVRAGFLNVDEAVHLLGSWELMRGGRLYVDIVDNKPPLIYAFYATAQLLFGQGITAVRLFAAAFLVPLTGLAAAAFFHYDRRGQAAAFAFVVASAALLASDGQVVHCEHLMLLPLAWSLAVLRAPCSVRRGGPLFAAGALVGIASLGKQPAAVCLGVYGLAVLFGQRRAHRLRGAKGGVVGRRAAARCAGRTACLLAALAAGFSLPVLAAAAWFAAQGSLDDVVFWTLRYNLSHVDNPMPLADKAVRVVTMVALVLPAAAPLLAAAWLGRASGACVHRRWILGLFALATFLPAWLGLRLFGHYFLPFLFVLALAAGPFLAAQGSSRAGGFAGAGTRPSEGGAIAGARRPALARVAVAVLAGLGLVGMTVASRMVHDPRRTLADVSRPAYEQIGSLVRGDACGRDGSLFVWGYAPTVYAYAGERPASRFVVPIDTLTGYLAGNDASQDGRLDTHGRIHEAHWDRLMDDLESRRPEHLVDTAPGDLNRWGHFSLDRFPRLAAFVQRDYHVYAVIDGAVVYRSNACDAQLAEARR